MAPESTQGHKIRFHFKAARGGKKKIEISRFREISLRSFFFLAVGDTHRHGMAPSGLKLHAMIFSVGRLFSFSGARWKEWRKKAKNFLAFQSENLQNPGWKWDGARRNLYYIQTNTEQCEMMEEGGERNVKALDSLSAFVSHTVN